MQKKKDASLSHPFSNLNLKPKTKNYEKIIESATRACSFITDCCEQSYNSILNDFLKRS